MRASVHVVDEFLRTLQKEPVRRASRVRYMALATSNPQISWLEASDELGGIGVSHHTSERRGGGSVVGE